jgi:predicted choloylglycine hydrolase
MPKYLYRLCFGFFCFIGGIGFLACSAIQDQVQSQQVQQGYKRIQKDSTTFVLGPNRLQYHEAGLWEMYLEGEPYQRGWSKGKLAQELIHKQEGAFVQTLQDFVPSARQQWLVKGFLKFFNRDIEHYLQPEYKAEIKGIAQFTSNQYNYLAPNFERLLYFHAAHDLGHALRDLALVGCTSVALWGNKTQDGKLLIGRNFDFYAGDAFAEQKMIVFIRPEEGIPHAMVTWPGMVGAVSGMNLSGITVTINAGKSHLPHKAKTPISLLTREILQHAENLDDAIRIASSRQVFVAESILVASAQDKKAILLEVSPRKMDVYEVESSKEQLISTNHFKSDGYKQDKRNAAHAASSHSVYRFKRMEELIAQNEVFSPENMAALLRNRQGLGGKSLGMGNEMAINQLIAHHAVIFQPEDKIMWVSTAPYQLGQFVGYRLDDVFAKHAENGSFLADPALTLAEDPFLHTDTFQHYETYRQLSRDLQALPKSQQWNEQQLQDFERLNPDFWKTHVLIGNYYQKRKSFALALSHFRQALDLEISSLAERSEILAEVRRLERQLK